MSSRLFSVDILRGIAILGVLLSHCFPHEPVFRHLGESTPWFGFLGVILAQGVHGVPLFFVISGFCIHLSWARRAADGAFGQPNFLEFWRKRLRRLYPAYFLVVCLGMTMVLVSWMLGRAHFYPIPKGPWIAVDFAAHATMLHGFHPLLDHGGGNPPLWSLAREEYLYLMYFVLLAGRRRISIQTCTLAVMGLGLAFPRFAAFFIREDSPYHAIIRSSAVVLWIQWSLGAVAAEAYAGLITLPPWCRSAWLVPIWFAAANLSRNSAIYGLRPILYGLAFFTLLNAAVTRETNGLAQKDRLLTLLANLGVISFSVYLIHYPTIMALREVSNFIREPLSAGTALVGWGLKALVSLFAALVLFHVVERRFLNAPVKFWSNREH